MAGKSTFTKEIGDKICERIAEGESLRSICLDDDMPCLTTVRNWLTKGDMKEGDEYVSFLLHYARAREDQADYFFDQGVDLIKKMQSKEIDPNTGRVSFDILRWSAGRMKPKKYGDKVDLDLGGNVTIKVNDVAKPEDTGQSG